MPNDIFLDGVDLSTLGGRIKYARKEKKMSQVQLGKAVGVTQSAVGQWERGETKEMTPSNLLRAADALDCNPVWLVTGEGKPYDRAPETDALFSKMMQLDQEQRAVVLAVVEGLLRK